MSSISSVGVKVPVHVILSLEVIVANEPFCSVISASLLNPDTLSENWRVTVAVSPTLSEVSDIVNETTDGAVVSITNALFARNEPVAFGEGNVSAAELPATSLIVPPFRDNESVAS